jgi:hypothetical protein
MRTSHNSMFLQWCRDELVLSFIFVQRFSTWTGRGFDKAPLQKHKRCAQGGKVGSGDNDVFILFGLVYRTIRKEK